MKQLAFVVMVLTMATTLSAAVIQSTDCGTLGTPLTPCLSGDKIFENFLSSDGSAATITVTESVPKFAYVVDINGLFDTDFTYSYDVQVDTGVCAKCRIWSIGYGLTGVSRVDLPTIQATVNGNTSGPTTGQTLWVDVSPPTAGSLTVHNAFVAHGGFATRLSNTILQTEIPEPLTLGLTGLGLGALAFFARRKFVR